MTHDNTNQEAPSLLHFPCEFVIKIFGKASDEFELQALTIIRAHVEDIAEDAIKSRLSKDSKYLALSITVPLDSREQLDAIYRDLSSNPLILMAL
jgi:putative lipoic acid-binding regulatory protein